MDPEVHGIRSSPARRIIARRVFGRLSGACSWGPPGPQSRSDTDSSIIPWLPVGSAVIIGDGQG